MIDTEKLTIRKEIISNLVKSAGIENQKAKIILCMDASASMEDMYADGSVQEIIERVIPIASQFDNNSELDLYIFSTYCEKTRKNVSMKNLDGFVKNELLEKYDLGGTSYAPAIKMIHEQAEEMKTFFSEKMEQPILVIFITDGKNDDPDEAQKEILELSKTGAFIQFIGIGTAELDFLKGLDAMEGRLINNTNFLQVRDLSFMSDEELYTKLMTEFPSWMKLAKEKNMIE